MRACDVAELARGTRCALAIGMVRIAGTAQPVEDSPRRGPGAAASRREIDVALEHVP
jgi:hypothetical protein